MDLSKWSFKKTHYLTLLRFHLRHLLGVFTLLYSTIANADQFVIGVNDAYANSVGKERVTKLFETMYRPLGISPSIRFYPSMRGLRLANRGEIDAEAGRVLGVADDYSELIPIPEPMIKHDVGYFCLQSANCQQSRDAIYALAKGFVAGQEYCEDNNLQCLSSQGTEFSIGMLINGAIDGVIGSLTSTKSAICQSSIKRIFYRNEKQLEVVSYHLINKMHRDKVSALQASIKSMRTQQYFTQFVAENSKIDPDCNLDVVEL